MPAAASSSATGSLTTTALLCDGGPTAFREIDAASQELQTVKLAGTMNYHLEAARANELYQTVGLDFADKVIDPAFNDFIKEVVPQYPVTEILARYGILVDDIYISNIAFSAEYQTAIERKQTARQNVETEQQILRQKEIQAPAGGPREVGGVRQPAPPQGRTVQPHHHRP